MGLWSYFALTLTSTTGGSCLPGEGRTGSWHGNRGRLRRWQAGVGRLFSWHGRIGRRSVIFVPMKQITRAEAKARGLKRYFTGKPCKRGHVCERIISNRRCVECLRILRRQWHDANRDRESGRRREWRATNPEYHLEWAKNNRETARGYCRRFYWENIANQRDRARKTMATLYLADKALIEFFELNGLIEKGASWKEKQIVLRAFKLVEKQTNAEYEKWLTLITA
jgi:hypothetical protein